jgi:glycosyltransferase involved in cell wall biosynthesis
LIEYKDIEFKLLYFDYKYQLERYLRPLNDRVEERVIPIPYRLLIPGWRKFSFPPLEMIEPNCGLFYSNELYFPPAKNTLVLATIHGLSYRIIPEKIPSQIVRAFEKGLTFVLKNSDYLVAVSETTKRELITHAAVDPERIYVVTHGVSSQFRKLEDQHEVWDRLRSSYGLNRHYILYVGAIGIHKNIMGILLAYERLFRMLPVDLVLVGPPDSAWDEAHRFVVDSGLTDRVHFLGYVPHAGNGLVDLYNVAKLFVFPSFYEGWTSSALEAMACGTPVITSNCSSLPETVGNAAIKVDPDSPESLAQEVERVLSDEALQSDLIKKGFAHVASHTWANAAARLIDVFADVQARGPWKNQKK